MDRIAQFEPQIQQANYERILKEFKRINDSDKFKNSLSPAIKLFESLENDIKKDLVDILQISSVTIRRSYNIKGKKPLPEFDDKEYAVQNVTKKEFKEYYKELVDRINKQKIA